MTTTPVTAILLNWKRPGNLPEIVSGLKAYEFVDQIVIWNNSDDLLDLDVRIIDSPRNRGTYGRALAAGHARNDLLYTQDDDLIVPRIDVLYRQFLGHGNKIVHGLDEGHYKLEANRMEYALLGYGSFFKRRWILDSVRPWIDRYGEDPLLESKCDRIWTTLFGRFDPVLVKVEQFKDARGPMALYRQKDHQNLVREARRKARALKEEIDARRV